jgi:hypothetical protein
VNQVDELMDRIADVMVKTPYNSEFESLMQRGDAKKVFLWLDEKWRNGQLPLELGPLLTDLFFMLH